MIFKPLDKSFNERFQGHVLGFVERLGLINSASKVVVALSGGEDSMALLHFFYDLKERGIIQSVRAIHIHHGTRVSQDAEEKIVRLFCEALRVKLQVFYLHDLKDNKNFEAEARKRRYQVFNQGTFSNEIVATGHHLDDSFEWSLMQSFKSSEVNSSLGIPVRRGKFIRPFLSVSKKQIEKYRKNLDLPYVKDPTNESVQYERNELRLTLIPQIAKRYPHYLKHYARKQNLLAQQLNLSLIKTSNQKSHSLIGEKSFWLNYKENPDAQSLITEIKRHLKTFSQERWRAGNQLQQLTNMLSQKKIGPMHLAGRLSCYNHSGFIGILPQDHRVLERPEVKFCQESFEAFLEKFENALLNPKMIKHYPLFIALEEKFKGPKFHTTHPLWPGLKEWSELNSLHITDARSLLDWWRQVRARKKTLRLAYLW